MTFHFGMLVVTPAVETFTNPSFKNVKKQIWRIELALNLNAIKIHPGNIDFPSLPPKARAKAFFLDLLLPSLSKRLDEGNLEFAPRFVLYQDDLEKFPRPDKEFIFPLRNGDSTPSLPPDPVMEDHNQSLEALEKGATRPDSFSTLCDLDSPLAWFDCAQIFRMLEEGQASTKNALAKDPEAGAFVSIWKHMLNKLDLVQGKVIFLFFMAASDTFMNERSY